MTPLRTLDEIHTIIATTFPGGIPIGVLLWQGRRPFEIDHPHLKFRMDPTPEQEAAYKAACDAWVAPVYTDSELYRIPGFAKSLGITQEEWIPYIKQAKADFWGYSNATEDRRFGTIRTALGTLTPQGHDAISQAVSEFAFKLVDIVKKPENRQYEPYYDALDKMNEKINNQLSKNVF